jgi:phage shock protein C
MEKKLQRVPHEGALAGVCAGLAEYLDVDKAWVRVFFVISVIFSSGFGIGLLGPVVYIVLWIVLPVKSIFENSFHAKASREAYPNAARSPLNYEVDYRISESEENSAFERKLGFQESAYSYSKFKNSQKNKSNDRVTSGAFLLVIGLVLLFFQLDFLHWSDMRKFWPVIVMFLGLTMIFNSFSRPNKIAYLEEDPNTGYGEHSEKPHIHAQSQSEDGNFNKDETKDPTSDSDKTL